MSVTGWTWRELCETPYDVVQKYAFFSRVKSALENNERLELE